MNYVSENIRVLRKRNGWTQEKFAELIGSNRKVVGSYEEGRAMPPLNNLNKISQVFNVSIENLTQHRFATDNSSSMLFNQEGIQEKEIGEIEVKPAVSRKKPFSRTGGFPVMNEPSLMEGIPYISYKYFDKYILDSDFRNHFPNLPVFKLPGVGEKQDVLAFDVPVDSEVDEGIVFAEKINNISEAEDGEIYLIISLTNGILLNRIDSFSENEIRIHSLKLALKTSEIKELRRPIGYFSSELPQNPLELNKLKDKIRDLRNDLDQFL